MGLRARVSVAGISMMMMMMMMVTVAPGATAALAPVEGLTYLPHGFVHSERAPALREETLAALAAYGIGQELLPVKGFNKKGVLKLSRHESASFGQWAASTRAYDEAHGAGIVAVASISGKVKSSSLNLEEPAVRANMLAGVEAMLALGAGGISLDLEPYPSTPGFVALLEEIDALFARRGFDGRLAVTAPASAGRWSPSYLGEVTAHLDQVDPLFYDSESTSASAYEQWVREGLAYWSANAAPGVRIVPDLPSYGPNRWHVTSVENIATATTAVEGALSEGSRVNGAGVFWWWGFYLDEEGAYDGAADREAWLGRTVLLPFS